MIFILLIWRAKVLHLFQLCNFFARKISIFLQKRNIEHFSSQYKRHHLSFSADLPQHCLSGSSKLYCSKFAMSKV